MLRRPLAVGQAGHSRHESGHSCLELVEACFRSGYLGSQQLVAARRRAPRLRWRDVGTVEQVGASALRVAVANSGDRELFDAARNRCGRWWWCWLPAGWGRLPFVVLVVSHAAVGTVVDRGEHLLIGGGASVLGSRGWDARVGVVRLVEVALFSGWFSDRTSRRTVVSLDRGSRRYHPVGQPLAEFPVDGVELVRSQPLDFDGRLIRLGRHWWRKASLPKGGTCPAECSTAGRPNIGRATTYQHPLVGTGQNLDSCAVQLYEE